MANIFRVQLKVNKLFETKVNNADNMQKFVRKAQDKMKMGLALNKGPLDSNYRN